MEGKTLSDAARFLRDQRRRRRWSKVVSFLSAVVVFCTTYVLILPAITMEQRTIAAQCGNVTAEATFAPDMLPEDVQLAVTPLSEKDAQIEAWLAEEAQKNGRTVAENYYFDVSFLDQTGNPVEPSGEVTVKLAFNEPMLSSEQTKWELFHIAETETESLTGAATMQTNAEMLSSITFNSSAFSVYVLSAQEILPAAEGEANEVIEGVPDAPAANAPAGGDNYSCPSDCDLDKELIWEKSSDSNPFGGAYKYNAFLFGDLTNWNDIEGNAAVMNNITERNQGISYPPGHGGTSTGNPIPEFGVGLLLGGTIELPNGQPLNVLNGSVIVKEQAVADKIAMYSTNKGHIHIPDPLEDGGDAIAKFFKDAQTDLEQKNSGLFTTNDDAGDVVRDKRTTWGSMYLKGTDPFLNVFTLSEEDYKAHKKGQLPIIIELDVPYGSYVIFNVKAPDGTTVVEDFAPELRIKDSSGNWVVPTQNKNDNQLQSQRILFNFDPTIEKVVLNTPFYLYGSVLAPKMDWEINGVYVGVDGTVVLENADGNGTNSEFHYNPFIPWSKTNIKKYVKCDCAEDANCEIHQQVNWNGYWVRLKLEEIVDKEGSHAEFDFEFEVSKGGEIKTLAPGRYRVKEVEFFKKNAEGNKEETVLFPGHYFSHVSFKVGSTESADTIVIPEGESVTVEITNNYTTEARTNIGVHKLWRMPDGTPIIPEEGTNVQVQLYSTTTAGSTEGGTPVKEPVMLKAEDGWYYAWVGLPAKDDAGNPLYYYVKEVGGEMGNFVPEYPDKPIQSGTYTITNKKLSVTVIKEWLDSAGEPITDTSNLPAVWVQLLVDKKESPEYGPVKLSFPKWSYSWAGLPEGHTYTVKELTNVPGFGTENVGSVNGNNGEIVIKNKKTVTDKSTELSVIKQWEDINGNRIEAPADRPVTLKLYQQKGTMEMVDVTIKFPVRGKEWIYNNPNWACSVYEDIESFPVVEVPKGGKFEFTILCFYSNESGELPTEYPVSSADVTLNCKNGITVGTHEYMEADYRDVRDTNAHETRKGRYITITGSIDNVTADTELVFTLSPDTYIGTAAGVDHPNTQISTTTSGGSYVWGKGAPYTPENGSGEITLNGTESSAWSYTWKDLPKDNSKEGTPATEVYRYYVLEEPRLAGFIPIYTVGGNDFMNPDDNGGKQFAGTQSITAMPGISEGIITVTNREKKGEGIILPGTGGEGTHLYTAAGLLLIGAAGLLWYGCRKRRKEATDSS